MARPIVIDDLIATLDGSDTARERLGALLKSISGELQFQEAADQIKVSPQRLHTVRNEALQAALTALEPKALGRPAAAPPDPNLAIIAKLEQALRDANVEREIGHLREELIAAGMGSKLKGLQKKRRR
jgi:hypothetical protein